MIDVSKSSPSLILLLLPPYILYKAKKVYEGWTEGGFPNTRYNTTAETFEDWFLTIALPYFNSLEGSQVMLGDNICSHLTVNVCENNKIKFVLHPPNSTDLLQPLDVAYFRRLKYAWKKTLEDWKLKNRGVLPKAFSQTFKRNY